MSKELMIKGKQEFMGVQIPVIEGGFEEKQKVILAKDIAGIHSLQPKRVNELINNNLDEFEFGVDILDLKQVGSKDLFFRKWPIH